METRLAVGPLFPQAFRLCAASPLRFALLSVPSLIAEVSVDWFTPNEAASSVEYIGSVIVAMAAFCFFSEATTAALYHWTRSSLAETPAGALRCLMEALRASRRWYPAVLCALALIVLGSLLILPALYFMAVFAFVTPCAMESKQSAPINILIASKNLMAVRFWSVFPLVCSLIVLGIGVSLGLSEWFNSMEWFDGSSFWSVLLGRIGSNFLGVVYHSYITVFFSLLFIQLRRDREQTRLRDTGKSSSV
jgi:hypothetical protein